MSLGCTSLMLCSIAPSSLIPSAIAVPSPAGKRAPRLHSSKNTFPELISISRRTVALPSSARSNCCDSRSTFLLAGSHHQVLRRNGHPRRLDLRKPAGRFWGPHCLSALVREGSARQQSPPP